MSDVVVTGGFDALGSRDLRLFEEAAKLGRLTVLLWADAAIQAVTGNPPRFPLAERLYLLQATRFVSDCVVWTPEPGTCALPAGLSADIWVEHEAEASEQRRWNCGQCGISYRVFSADDLRGFPHRSAAPSHAKKVVVTGCYDWFHSGHVRFFEEAAALGDVYVVVGHDRNIRSLKGEGHPLIPQEERRYVVGSIKHVKQALISTGDGWLDADPEIRQIKPDYYVVNEDGDKGGKRQYCEANGVQYVVLKREPAPGLPRRSSTDLRGF